MARNRSFKIKLLASTMAPIAALLGFAGVLVKPKVDLASEAKDNQVSVQHVQRLVGLSASLEDERDITVWSRAVPKNAILKRDMAETRKLTDIRWQELQKFEASLPAEERWASGMMGGVSDLMEVRGAANVDRPDLDLVLRAYSTRIDSLVNATRKLSTASSDLELNRSAASLVELAEARNQYSLLRGAAVRRLGSTTLLQRDAPLLLRHDSAAKAGVLRFSILADARTIVAMESRMKPKELIGRNSFDEVLADLLAPRVQSTNAQEWWDDQSPRINELTRFIDDRVVAYGSRAVEVESDARRSAIIYSVATAAVVLLSALIALAVARSLSRRLADMAKQARHIATVQLPDVLAALRHPTAEAVAGALPTVRSEVNDELGVMADAFNSVLHTSVRTSLEHSTQRAQTVTAMLVNLGRRNQSLIDRQLKIMDRLEAKEKDPEVLEALYEVDHLVTRMRRNAENLLVLSGQKQARTWSKPVSLYDVLRSAAAEVSDLNRAVIADVPSNLTMSGPFAVDVCHLLAELVENATRYSPKTTLVSIGSVLAVDQVVVSIVDSGVGMGDTELDEFNARLEHPPEIDELVADRVGFQVVGRLSRKVGASVRLRRHPLGGTIAEVVLPQTMFVESAAFDPPAAAVRASPKVEPVPASEMAPLEKRQVSEKQQWAMSSESSAPAGKPSPAEAVLLDVERLLGSEKAAKVPVSGPSRSMPVDSIPAGSVVRPDVRPDVRSVPSGTTSITDRLVAEAAAEFGVSNPTRITASNSPASDRSSSDSSSSDSSSELPQRSRQSAPSAEIFGFSSRLAEPSLRSDLPDEPPRRGPYAAIQEAKRALQDASLGTLGNGSLGSPEPATEIEVPAVIGGLTQRRPGKVFSSAEKAADAGEFRRLGDGSHDSSSHDASSARAIARFAALSKLQRGVTTARTNDSPNSSVED